VQGVSIAADSGSGNQKNNNASQPLKLSLEDAIKKGVANDPGLTSMDISIKKMWRVTDEDKSFKEISNNTQSELDELDEYYKLSERKRLYDNLTNFEEELIVKYRDKYGDAPYYRETLYENYLNGRAFSNYSSWLQILSLKDTYDTSKTKSEVEIRKWYYNVLNATEVYEYIEGSVKTIEKQYTGIVLAYEKGFASEMDKYQIEVSLEQSRLQLKKVKRLKEVEEMLLKQMCGIEPSQSIELTSRDAGLNKEYSLDTYKNYCDKALANRSEVVNAKLKLEVYKKELGYYDEYIKQKYAFDRLNLQQQVEDAEFAVTQNILEVTSDIQAAYTAVKSVQSEMEIQKRNAQNKKFDYNIAEKKYSLGQISLIDLWNAKDAANSADIDYKDSQRNMDYSLYKLELACTLGPAYN
jgi:hypothetical protein